MTLRRKGVLLGRIALGAGLVTALAAGWSTLCTMTDRQALKGVDLSNVREQALTMFPRGSRLTDAADHLAAIGFDCEPLAHYLPDTSAPALLCASNGRGFPNFPAVNLTVVTRNGLIADIEVWNVIARADGEVDDVDMTATGTIRGSSARDSDDESASTP